MQIRYERTAALKKAVAEQLDDVQIPAGLDLQLGGQRSSIAVSEISTNPVSVTNSKGLRQSLIAQEDYATLNARKLTAKKSAFYAEQSKDAYLFRFKPGSSYLDRVVPAKELGKMLDYKVTDNYWNQLDSITVTPISNRGLG